MLGRQVRCVSSPGGASLAWPRFARTARRAGVLVVVFTSSLLVDPSLGQAESFADRAAAALQERAAAGPVERLPPPRVDPPRSNSAEELTSPESLQFPPLPPPPERRGDWLPPLEEELWQHGGSYLYQPEGDRLGWPDDGGAADEELLRLPEDWIEPQPPLTLFSEFLGADPIFPYHPASWLWQSEYAWDRRFAAYGSYELFGFALQQGRGRQDVVGHQLLVDLDLRVTGTERLHAQFRPLGRRDTGGSYYQFSAPAGYEDNATGLPDRYWFETELHSLLGPTVDPFADHDLNLAVGRFPFAMHNSLLMNDDIVGAVASRNNIQLGRLSNLNVQLLSAIDSVDAIPGSGAHLYCVHSSIDHRKTFYELTYAFVDGNRGGGDLQYLGLSRTKAYGPLGVAVRGLFKIGNGTQADSSELIAVESNYAIDFEHGWCGYEHAVAFCNAFWAGEGWSSLGGANFNRLRTAFVVNPLVRLAAGPSSSDVFGLAAGVQLFRHHDDESIIPEVAWESPDGRSVLGLGLRYLRKTGPRTFLELLAVLNTSDDSALDREGVFVSHRWLF